MTFSNDTPIVNLTTKPANDADDKQISTKPTGNNSFLNSVSCLTDNKNNNKDSTRDTSHLSVPKFSTVTNNDDDNDPKMISNEVGTTVEQKCMYWADYHINEIKNTDIPPL